MDVYKLIDLFWYLFSCQGAAYLLTINILYEGGYNYVESIIE